MSIEEDIAAWARTRPAWQQRVLGELAEGKSFDPSKIKAIAQEIRDGASTSATPLQAGNVSGGQIAGTTVTLASVKDATNVNALLDAQELTFGGEGLTVIYGDNGSGKSGYARLIKSVVGARHHEPVHANVFADTSNQPQKAEVTFSTNGATKTAAWPTSVSDELRAISFYDEACGDEYIGGESELTYRPSALTLLDGLIAVCDEVRKVLDEELRENDLARGDLPSLPSNSDAATFLSKLSGTTTNAETDLACEIPKDGENQLGNLLQEEARLRSTDPSKERTRIEAIATKVGSICSHVATVEQKLSHEEVTQTQESNKNASELRAAATMASSQSFDSEPIRGVGAETWRTLWDAARKFSEVEAYRDESFPYTGEDARCVLCHQELSSDAGDRLARFDAFMRDTTAQRAATAEADLARRQDSLKALDPTPPHIAAELVELRGHDSVVAESVSAWLQAANSRKASILASLAGSGSPITELGASVQQALRDLESDLQQKAASIDAAQFQQNLTSVVKSKDNLEGRITLSRHRGDITAEIKRLAEKTKLDDSKRLVDTTGITRKSTELTEAHVTTVIRDRFIRESDRLCLERIELRKTGGQKGKLRHRPSLLGAKTSRPVDQVLSEGEQTALGLAGFFTEAHFDDSKSALVLDDPVTSLDHIRRSRVANRLAELAVDRQVIVFTHDLTFVGDLAVAAAKTQVGLAERCIERRGGKTPGMTTEKHPWKAKDVGRRFNELEQYLAVLKKERPNWTQDEYEKECAEWAGKLSETWERLINLEIVYPLVDPGTSHVQPKMFKVLARITETDNQDFQQSYERCSAWVRRHDKSQATNYVAPEPDELDKELAFVRGWFDRVKKYRN
jgi:energy-coupling factor transporter ATP-binding protein EcfA2